MAELLLINPTTKVKKMVQKKRRSAAQRAATARLVAFNKARRSGTTTHRRRRRTSARKTNPVQVVTKYRRARPAAKTVHHRRRRRNPSGSVTGPMAMLTNALLGASGAVAVSAIYSYAPLPAALKSGYMAPVTKGALAIALGMFGRRFLGRNAVKMAEGALTVTLTDTIKMLATGSGLHLGYYAPAEQLNGPQYGMLPAPSPSGDYVNTQYSGYGLSEYLSGDEMSEYVS